MTRIALADDHGVVRHGIATLLAEVPGFFVVGETGDGLEVVPLVERLAPDVLLLDLVLPGLGGTEVLRRLAERPGRVTRTVVLSMQRDHLQVVRCFHFGARAFVFKDAEPDEVVHAVREAAAGRRYVSRPFSLEQIDAEVDSIDADLGDPVAALTAREREVLQLVAEGRTSAEIGQRLGIGRRTVESHRGHILEKLLLSGQAELIRFAIDAGLAPKPALGRPLQQPPPRGEHGSD